MTKRIVPKLLSGGPAVPYRSRARPCGGPFFLLLAFLMGSPSVLLGQSARWQVDLNGSRIRYDTLETLNAPSLVTQVEWQGRRALGRIGGSVTGFQDNGWSVQGRGDFISWLSPAGVRNPLRLELSGGLGGARHSSGFQSYAGQADTRFHLQGGNLGLWLGAGIGVSENSFDTGPVRSFLPNLGGWIRLGSVQLTARVLDTRIDGERFPEANLSGIYARGPVELTLYTGARNSPFEGEEMDSWVGGSLAIWLRSGLAVLLAGGQYAPDLLQGLPGGEFVSLGFRLASRRRRPVIPSTPLPLMFTRDSAGAGGIRFAVDGAESVSVAGDWNAWMPTPLARDREGRWVLPRELPPGVYRFNLLVDGTEWIVPEGVPTVEDGFGGQVGILVISEG